MPQDVQKSSKSRSDTAVQGTNDSSIVSKCSMASRGYFNDEFVSQFVAKQSRRSSLINRGYYVRAKALEHVFNSFFTWCKGNQNQVISIGAGFDSAYFRLKSDGLLRNTNFVEVDFPDLVRRKVALIQNSPKLSELLKDELKIPDEIQKLKDICPLFSSPDYHIIGCDLKQVAKLTSCLQHCGIDFQLPTLIVSECVITYIGSKSSNPVIQWIGEAFPHAIFVSYEQIYPNDAFGRVMCSHFKKIGSPLKSIEKFPTPKHHIERYCALGWASCVCVDMNELYCNVLPQTETKRIEDLELFDEYEEFHSKCSHYMICCAFNGACQELKSQIKKENAIICEEQDKNHCITCTVYPCDSQGVIKRYGHKSALIDGSRIVCTGGFGVTSEGHSKVSQVQLLDTGSGTITEILSKDMNYLDCRMHHTLTRLSDTQLLMFGGRKSPAKPLSNSCLLNIVTTDEGTVYTCESLSCSIEPEPRWRHSTTVIECNGRQQVFLYGGKSTQRVFGDLWMMDVISKQWSEVTILQTRPSASHSHACCMWKNKIVLSGGLDEESHPIGCVTLIDTENWSCSKLQTTQEIQPRYSHTSHVVNDILILVGGVSTSPVTFGLTTINLLTGSVRNYPLMDENIKHPVMLFKTTSELKENKLLIFGGGGNCFSFGTHFNISPLVLEINQILLNVS